MNSNKSLPLGGIQNNYSIQNNVTNLNQASIDQIVETVYDSLDKLKTYILSALKD